MDGNISVKSNDVSKSDDESDDDNSDTIYDTDEEVDVELIPANLFPVLDQNIMPDQPLQFDVNTQNDDRSSFIPLCLMMNCRSVCNKRNNLNEMIQQICPDLIIASETW